MKWSNAFYINIQNLSEIEKYFFGVSSEILKCICQKKLSRKVFLTLGVECNDGIVL